MRTKMVNFNLKLDQKISLYKTLDIQIPALEWLRVSKESYRTIYLIGKKRIEILVKQKSDNLLTFSWNISSKSLNDEIKLRIRNSFGFPLKNIKVGTNKNLLILQRYYDDLFFMKTEPFKALLVTILSQNKTGEATRKAFFELSKELNSFSPTAIINLGEKKLKRLIRTAGPYKTRYLIESSKRIISDFGGSLEEIMKMPIEKALNSLIMLPGVAYKTAACVLNYAGQRKDVVPVDTHLGRVVQRIGLLKINRKIITPSVRREIENQFTNEIPNAGFVHLFFIMLGRELCFAKNPLCSKCPLQKTCLFYLENHASNT